jgi:hypothetical protein
MYTLRSLDQTFQVPVQDDFVFVTFTELTGEKARLVTAWRPEAEPRSCGRIWRETKLIGDCSRSRGNRRRLLSENAERRVCEALRSGCPHHFSA